MPRHWRRLSSSHARSPRSHGRRCWRLSVQWGEARAGARRCTSTIELLRHAGTGRAQEKPALTRHRGSLPPRTR
jgi:hypothetical protein